MRESSLLQHVYEASRGLGPRVLIPPGDDMTSLQVGGAEVLAAVDQVVAGRHFDPDRTAMPLVGGKAMRRCLSDVAAMAARPVAALAAVCLPAGFEEEAARELFRGLQEAATAFECPVAGGDITIHDGPLIVSVTVIAEPAGRPPVLRRGARPGDGIYVTGVLGGSFGDDGLGRHLTFTPRVREAIALAETLGDRLHAMIDVSDGLGRDAGHLAGAGGVRIEIDASAIPLATGVVRWQDAVSDGEDYELCFAAAGDVPARVLDVGVSRIGEVVPCDTAGVYVREAATLHDVSEHGWDHAS